MKKVLLVALVALMGLSASAQVRTSRTLMKRSNPAVWYARTGMALWTPYGMDEYDKEQGWSASGKVGFDLDFGFNKPIGRKGVYWGMDLGFMTRGTNASYTEEFTESKEIYKGSVSGWAVKLTPFSMGYKYALSEDIKVDLHAGLFAMIQISQKTKEPGLSRFDNLEFPDDSAGLDGGLQVGAGVWYRKFNVDLSYQAGFAPVILEPEMKLGALLLRVGYAF